jgi:hypothetical protein
VQESIEESANGRRAKERKVQSLDSEARGAIWASLAGLVVSVIAVGFTFVEIRHFGNALEMYTRQTTLSNWLEFERTIVEHPNLRPYFRSGQTLEKTSPDFAQVAAAGDMLLDIIDTNLESYEHLPLDPSWRESFRASFKKGPILCEILRENSAEYSKRLHEFVKDVC